MAQLPPSLGAHPESRREWRHQNYHSHLRPQSVSRIIYGGSRTLAALVETEYAPIFLTYVGNLVVKTWIDEPPGYQTTFDLTTMRLSLFLSGLLPVLAAASELSLQSLKFSILGEDGSPVRSET